MTNNKTWKDYSQLTEFKATAKRLLRMHKFATRKKRSTFDFILVTAQNV